MLRAWPFRVAVLDPETKAPFKEHNHSGSADAEKPFVACYIESKTGSKFKLAVDLVKIPDHSEMYTHSFAAKVTVDGQEIVQKLIGNISGKRHDSCTIDGLEIGPGKIAPFVFGATQFSGYSPSLRLLTE
jgi:hypothetical protein